MSTVLFSPIISTSASQAPERTRLLQQPHLPPCRAMCCRYRGKLSSKDNKVTTRAQFTLEMAEKTAGGQGAKKDPLHHSQELASLVLRLWNVLGRPKQA